MWEPYKDVCLKYLKNAEISVDPFHVIKHLTDGFDRIRIDTTKQCIKGSPAYYLLKPWYKLLTIDYSLDNEPVYNVFFKQKMNRRNLYDALLSVSPELEKAYHLKEL